MQESQWQKKKKRKRSQSRNDGLPAQNGGAVTSASKSLLQRLQGVIDRLQSRTCSVDLRNDGPAFVKLATQVVTNEECSLREGCLASCLVTHLLRRCTHDGQANTGGKLQMNPQHLLPFAKAIVSRVSPAAELHLPHLAVLSQLMVVHPGVCISLRTQMEESLLPWLNFPHSAGAGHTKATSRAAVALAGDVWSLLPVPSVAGAADDDQAQGGRGTKGAGQRGARVAAARGAQLQQLMAALQAQLDRLLAGVVQIQGPQTSKKATKEALRIPPIVDHHPAQAPKKIKKSSGQNPKKNQTSTVNLGANDTGSADDITDPVKLVEVSVCRCCNLLVFADRLLRSVASGSNQYGITVAPKHLLLPLIRILQVSPASLQRYATTEVARLSQLWPSLHRTALTTLATAITTLDHNLALWGTVLQRQLVSTLLAAATVKKQNGGLASNKMADEEAVVELQDIVRLVYKCLALLMEACRGAVPVEVELLKEAMRDLTVQPSTLVTLQNLSRKSIANMKIKKKSKNKGYTIVPKNDTPAANDGDADTKVPLSLELSHGIVLYALELLQRVASSPSSHYTLTVDCARILHEELPEVARYFISEWRMFPHSLGELPACRSLADEYRHRPARWSWGGSSAGGGDVCYTSASGRADLRCFFRGQVLMDSLIRLVSTLATAGTARVPPHAAQLLHRLQAAQLLLQPSHQLRAAAQAGTRPLRFLLAHPRVATFSQAVEDIRAAALSEIAAAASRRVSEDDAGDGSEPSLSGGDDGDASDGDQASLSGDDGDDGSTNNEEIDEIGENIKEINGNEHEINENEEEMLENYSEIDGSLEEINGNVEEKEENSIMEESTFLDVNGDVGKSAEEEDRLQSESASTDTAGDKKQKSEKKGKNEKKVKGEKKKDKSKEEVKSGKKGKNEKKGKKEKSEEEVKSAKKKKKLLKKTKKAAESNGPSGSCVEQEGGGSQRHISDECQDDLSVEQMLAELAD